MNTGKLLGIIHVCVNSYISLNYDCYIFIIMTNDKKSFNIPNSCLNVQPNVIFGYIKRSQPCTHPPHTHLPITSLAPVGGGGGRVSARPRSPPGKSSSHLFLLYGEPFCYFFFMWWAFLGLPSLQRFLRRRV